ncbi:methylase [Ignicoccus islandicus DSM 13165]|uniref:Methylase n=1 Tax=Ignicoccus islandicus DSM 13165 TaxID=940295 RepID=A0A0U3FN38_9CREN|nr:methyltransferase domain-containing protein [Ignicoccus islandicus]ALU11383.1 methylase [Ignicoccus islandicus DSM 13165]
MKKLVPYIASPVKTAEKIVELAKVTPNDVLIDLGSGDGRIVVLTSKLSGCKGIGVEIDSALVAISRKKASEYGVSNRVEFIEGDFTEVDLSVATVIYLYIYYDVIRDYLVRKLEKEVKDGTRIVTLEIPIPNWMPIARRGFQDENGVVRTLYLYVKGVSDPSSWNNDELNEEWMEAFRKRLRGIAN